MKYVPNMILRNVDSVLNTCRLRHAVLKTRRRRPENPKFKQSALTAGGSRRFKLDRTACGRHVITIDELKMHAGVVEGLLCRVQSRWERVTGRSGFFFNQIVMELLTLFQVSKTNEGRLRQESCSIHAPKNRQHFSFAGEKSQQESG